MNAFTWIMATLPRRVGVIIVVCVVLKTLTSLYS